VAAKKRLVRSYTDWAKVSIIIYEPDTPMKLATLNKKYSKVRIG